MEKKIENKLRNTPRCIKWAKQDFPIEKKIGLFIAIMNFLAAIIGLLKAFF